VADCNVTVLNHDPIFGVMKWPVGSSDTIDVGDLVGFDGTDLEKVDAAADDQLFCGVANGKSLSGSTAQIQVYIKCIATATVAEATYVFGAGLKYNTGGYLETDGGGGSAANTLAHVFGFKSGTITSTNVKIDVAALGAGTVDNGLTGKLWKMAGINA